MKKRCSDEKSMVKEYGPEIAKKLRQRLMELKASSNLHDFSSLPAPRCHQLNGRRDNQFAADLKHPFRLIFEPNNDPTPLKADGGFDISRITSILIIEVVNYHDD